MTNKHRDLVFITEDFGSNDTQNEEHWNKHFESVDIFLPYTICIVYKIKMRT